MIDTNDPQSIIQQMVNEGSNQISTKLDQKLVQLHKSPSKIE